MENQKNNNLVHPMSSVTLTDVHWALLTAYIKDSAPSRKRELEKWLSCCDTVPSAKSFVEHCEWLETELQKIVETITKRSLGTKHYVVVLDWAADDAGERGVSILGVAHSLPEAKKIFAERIEKERMYADDGNWTVYSDTDTDFDAGEDGDYNDDHTHLYIQEVE